MPNKINNSNPVEYKNYISLTEFETFYKFPDGNPLLIVNTERKIIFSNSAFKNTFNLNNNETFFSLCSEPDLSYLLFAVTGSNFNNFHFDLLLKSKILKIIILMLRLKESILNRTNTLY
jgi:hypothetical protein